LWSGSAIGAGFAKVEDELGRHFDAEIGPLLRATLVLGKPAAEIILSVHHSIGDGLSAL